MTPAALLRLERQLDAYFKTDEGWHVLELRHAEHDHGWER